MSARSSARPSSTRSSAWSRRRRTAGAKVLDRRPAPDGGPVRARPLVRADGADGGRQPHGHHAAGDLRPGHARDDRDRFRRGPAARQRIELRPVRLCLHQGPAPPDAADARVEVRRDLRQPRRAATPSTPTTPASATAASAARTENTASTATSRRRRSTSTTPELRGQAPASGRRGRLARSPANPARNPWRPATGRPNCRKLRTNSVLTAIFPVLRGNLQLGPLCCRCHSYFRLC